MKLRVALAQINPTVGDLAGNSALVRTNLKEAKSAGAHVAGATGGIRAAPRGCSGAEIRRGICVAAPRPVHLHGGPRASPCGGLAPVWTTYAHSACRIRHGDCCCAAHGAQLHPMLRQDGGQQPPQPTRRRCPAVAVDRPVWSVPELACAVEAHAYTEAAHAVDFACATDHGSTISASARWVSPLRARPP